MASKIEVDEIFNAGGDNDTGIDLATNDAVKIKIANAVKAEVDSSGHVKLDTVKGYTSAASVSVVGEGGSTTTNLQQGLAKVWAKCDEHTIEDSLNVTSSTDHGTGDYTITIANDMANVTYSLTLSSLAVQNQITAMAAGSYRRECSNSSGTVADVNFANSTVHGDLA